MRTMILPLVLALAGSLDGWSQKTLSHHQYDFTFDQLVQATEVKDQARSNTCWSFSTSSFIESELLRLKNQSLDLSEMYFVRQTYLAKAEHYLRLHGKTNFGEGGLAHDVFNTYRRHGAMPESAYSGLIEGATKHSHQKLHRELETYLDELIKGRHIDADWRVDFEEILDKHLGSLPTEFSYNDETYDAQRFAQEVVGLHADDYVTFTSFQHHPFYQKVVLELPDNFCMASYYNVPLEELVQINERALQLGQSVIWDCDVSEKGFSASQGLAILPDPQDATASSNTRFEVPHRQSVVTSQMRQDEFDSYSLTDDHLMHIIGVARDQHGDRYYYVKNSWGKSPGMEGHLLASEAYFKLNTIAITVHREAVPDHVRARFRPMIDTNF